MSLLEIKNLSTLIPVHGGSVHVVNNVSLSINAGQTVALAGESGSGKSMTARSIIGLLPPPGQIVSGSILFDGRELAGLPDDEMRRIRGRSIAMIFQEPMTSLNPVLRIGEQVMEPLILHRGLDKKNARLETINLLTSVGINNSESRILDYPHQLSGGMRQRVMIAMALACDPLLLIADEPTTALDVTIQAQILELIDEIKKNKGLALLLITHDLGIIAERADTVHVMYAGGIVESASAEVLFTSPAHPYSCGLIASLPENSIPGEPLMTIPGHPPDLAKLPSGCPFRDRCNDRMEICSKKMPAQVAIEPDHNVSCWKYI